MMNGFFGFVCLLLVGLTWLAFPRPKSDRAQTPDIPFLILLVGSFALSGLAFFQWKTHPTAAFLVWGTTAGITLGAVARWLDARTSDLARSVAGLGLAAALVSLLGIRQGLVSPVFVLSGCFGASIVAARVAIISRKISPSASSTLAVMALPLAALSILGGARGIEVAELSGGAFGAAMTLAGLVGVFLTRKQEGSNFGILLAGSLVGVAGWALFTHWLKIEGTAILALIGALIAIVSLWVLPERFDGSSLTYGVVAAIGIGLATFGFSSATGFGMALAAAAVLGVLAMAGGGRAMLAMSPLLALVALRIVREISPGSSRAFDIGQHYAILGILIGAAVVMISLEWGRRKPSGWAGACGGAALVVALGATMILLGAKGSFGLILGLGIGAWIAGFQGMPSIAILGGAAGLIALTTAWFKPFDPWFSLARQTKLITVGSMAGVVLVLFLITVVLSRTSKVQGS